MEKKKTYEKQLAEYEKQKDSELEEMRDVAQAEKEGIKHKFEQTEKSIVTKRKDQPKVRIASRGGDRGSGAEILPHSNLTHHQIAPLPLKYPTPLNPVSVHDR